MTDQQPSRGQIYFAFALVYVFWGSTYLALAVAGRHLGAALTSGLRFMTAGPLMLLWCLFSGRKIGLNLRDFGRLAAISFLLLTCGNTMLVWSEKFIPSGLASLFVAGVPIYIAVVEGFVLRGDRVSGRGWGGIALGTLGLFLLLWPELRADSGVGSAQLQGALVVLFGSFCWACGSILSRRAKVASDPFVASGWQMTIAGVVNLIIATAANDWREATAWKTGLLGVAYLVVFGSWVGYTAYIWLLEHVPTPRVATYAYVNPIVAVLLGCIFLHERLNAFSVAGMVVIVIAVVLVTSSKLSSRESRAEVPALVVVEPEA